MAKRELKERPGGPGRDSRRRSGPSAGVSARASAVAGAAVFATLVGSCAPYQPVNVDELLDDRLAARIGGEAARSLEVPFRIDDEMRQVVIQRVGLVRSENYRTNSIIDFVFEGLDLKYSLVPTRDAIGTYKARSGNCLSFVNLFVGLAREARLNPFYVEVGDQQRWKYRDGVVVSQGHIVAGMYVDGALSTFDFLPYRSKAYRDFEPIDDVTAIAHFYNNLGAEALLDGDDERAEELLALAVSLAPDFIKAVNNLGVSYLRSGRVERAVELYLRALDRDPQDVALLTNMARAYQLQGRSAEAEELLSQLEGVSQTSPFYFVYRGEMALGQGDAKRGLEFMREALRRDSEVPEVHVGLVKAYLALGDLRKARHHVERALRLDATNREARQLAAMLQAGRPEP